MLKKSRLVVASLLGVALLSAGMYTTKISDNEKFNPNPDFTNERIISISEKIELQQSLSNIVTEFGTFKRSDMKLETPHVGKENV
ncbi:hypothetical protein ACP8HI_13650 [Paenibacillus sp. FA6]|uniref:hypothetical protein n=1 Tax=Paenibacillus sp. FA6 TaxID=3413029 RepID=UPI003F65A9AE